MTINSTETPATRIVLAASATEDTINLIHAAVLAHGRSKDVARTRLLIDVPTDHGIYELDCNLRAFSPSKTLVEKLTAIPEIRSIETHSHV